MLSASNSLFVSAEAVSGTYRQGSRGPGSRLRIAKQIAVLRANEATVAKAMQKEKYTGISEP